MCKIDDASRLKDLFASYVAGKKTRGLLSFLNSSTPNGCQSGSDSKVNMCGVVEYFKTVKKKKKSSQLVQPFDEYFSYKSSVCWGNALQ